MRELRRAAEKEALEVAAKQRLMVCTILLLLRPSRSFIYIHQPGAFPPDGQDAGKWIKDLTQYALISLYHVLDLSVTD